MQLNSCRSCHLALDKLHCCPPPRTCLQKAAFMAAERSKSRPAGLRHLASNKLRDIIEAKALRSIRPRFDGLVWMMQEHPELGWVIVVAPAMMVVALILDRRQRSKRVSDGTILPGWLPGVVMMQEHPALGWVIVVMSAMVVLALILDRRQRSKRVNTGGGGVGVYVCQEME